MIPVVFIHFGECEYAAMTIAQAQARGNEVVFLNPPRDALYDYKFAQTYEHMSTNHVYFELACMVRWFVLRDWMMENGVPDCLYCDTDVLLFANVESEIHSDPYYHAQDFTLSLGTSGHTSYWTREALELFCSFLEVTYRYKDSDYKECVRIYSEMRAQNLDGGISDMFHLKRFAELSLLGGLRVGEMSVYDRHPRLWDHNFNASDGFKMEDGHKKVILGSDGGVYAQPDIEVEQGTYLPYVEFLSLHMQGGAKHWISQYLSVSNFS